jgi:FKBP-type peptidyl-prolyl cis-trans isomerase 2
MSKAENEKKAFDEFSVLMVELEGRDEQGNVFESTKGEIGKQLYGREGPILIIPSISTMLPGIKKALEGMGKGEKKKITLKPEDAFGKRKQELIRILPMTWFKKAKLAPEKDMIIELTLDGKRMRGIIKSVANGRVRVDFNHPLAGKTVTYEIHLVDIISKDEEKVKAILNYFGFEGYPELSENEAIIKVKKDIPIYQKTLLTRWISSALPNIKTIEFKVERGKDV